MTHKFEGDFEVCVGRDGLVRPRMGARQEVAIPPPPNLPARAHEMWFGLIRFSTMFGPPDLDVEELARRARDPF